MAGTWILAVDLHTRRPQLRRVGGFATTGALVKGEDLTPPLPGTRHIMVAVVTHEGDRRLFDAALYHNKPGHGTELLEAFNRVLALHAERFSLARQLAEEMVEMEEHAAEPRHTEALP